MASTYVSCADTAKLIRQALKESFPRIKFSVRSRTYAGGASIDVNWTDGPNRAQVEAVAGIFSGSYFDGSTDYKGATYALVDGVQTRFAADFIFCHRDNSDAAIERAIARVARDLQSNFTTYGIKVPTASQYRSGELVYVHPMGSTMDCWSLQSLISRILNKASDRLAVAKSKTAGKVIYLGNDGHSLTGALSAEQVAA